MYRAEQLDSHPFFKEMLQHVPIETLLDSLTGVVSRPYMLAFIRDLIRRGTPFTLAIVDLDNFKTVNDNHGHKTGDRVLAGVSARMVDYFGADGVVGRYGGDEFLAVYTKSAVYDEVHPVFMRMYHSGGVFRSLYKLEDVTLFVTATMGSAAFPTDATQFDELFARIDKALYRGKSKGRNCFIMYVAAKHDALHIPTLSKRSLYETFLSMAEGFDEETEPRRKLQRAFQPMRDNLHIQTLLYVSADGALKDAETGETLVCLDSVPEVQGIWAVSELTDLMTNHSALYNALSTRGLESVMFSEVKGEDSEFACLAFCPEAHTKRLWQDDEYAAAFILSRMLSQYLERHTNLSE
ncbi:MAG: GGDEF domain-containing protein [Oscillospiraceae bacterium]|nr:GGDEF domain-containing protein [Oscillospiraceae bacterium]